MTSLLAMPEAGYLLTPNGEESLPIDINVDATKGEVSACYFSIIYQYLHTVLVLAMTVVVIVIAVVVIAVALGIVAAAVMLIVSRCVNGGSALHQMN
jgi:hypothetical protein